MDQTQSLTASDLNYNHDNAITSFVLQAAIDGYKVIRILSIGIFVLVYWMFKAKIKTVLQIKKNLEGKVLLINATYRSWPKVSQTSGHAFLTGCCAISSFYEKGKVSALAALTVCNFSSLYTVFTETNASESDLMKAEKAYISAWYGQTKGTSFG